MKRIAAVLAAAAALSFAAPARAEDGKALFAQKCAVCHGPEGKGDSPMGKKLGVKDLTALKTTHDDVVAVLNAGKPPKMMAFKGKLTPEQIDAVATYTANGMK